MKPSSLLSGAVGALVVAVVGCSPSPGVMGGNYTKQIAQTSAGPIEYTLQGKGPVILKVVGAMDDCDSTMGNGALLAGGFSILTPSRPGYGKTPLSVGRTPEEAAEAMISLLDVLGVSGADVIAVSSGGPTAIYLASRHPERVQKLVLEDAVSKAMKELDPERYENGRKTYGSAYGSTSFMFKALARIAP